MLAQWLMAIRNKHSRPRRRKGYLISRGFEMENLEPRVVLSAENAGAGAVDVAAVFDSTEAAPPLIRNFSAPRKTVIDIKQWQGTWNVTTDVPFLGNGSVQITQTGGRTFQATTTGLNGTTLTGFKATGDDRLAFSARARDLAGNPKKVTFSVTLDTSSFASFSGPIKVSGENDHHSVSASKVSNTGPSTADVQVALSGPSSVKNGGNYSFLVGVQNLGPAPLPTELVQVFIYFETSTALFDAGGLELLSTQNVGRHGFSTVTPGETGFGDLVLLCKAEQLVSASSSTALLKVTLDLPFIVSAPGGVVSFDFVAVLADGNSTIPPNFEFLSSQRITVDVTGVGGR